MNKPTIQLATTQALDETNAQSYERLIWSEPKEIVFGRENHSRQYKKFGQYDEGSIDYIGTLSVDIDKRQSFKINGADGWVTYFTTNTYYHELSYDKTHAVFYTQIGLHNLVRAKDKIHDTVSYKDSLKNKRIRDW